MESVCIEKENLRFRVLWSATMASFIGVLWAGLVVEPVTLLHTSVYVSIRQYTSTYVSIRQYTSTYVIIRRITHTSTHTHTHTHTQHTSGNC